MDNEIIKQFKELPKDAKNVCLFLGKWGNTLAWNPSEKLIQTEKIDEKEIEEFIKRSSNKKRRVFGYISYDTGYSLHEIKETSKNDLRLPNTFMLAFDKWIENKDDLDTKKIETGKTPHKSQNFKPVISKTQYQQAYKKIKEYISAGDIYQINLTHRLEAGTNLSPRELFLRTAKTNPVDHLAYIEGDDFEVLSASPERFIKIEKQKIETQPVKGTRPRGKTEKEDKQMKKDLIESEKEAAELNMITDLLRNDLGKISEIGSVKVEGHRLISKCPTVWHTFSRIIGKISKKNTPIKALISMLPGGSITGCPKKRAMEIIDELEPTTRGIYTGVIGQIKPNGDLDFSIAIRTIIKKSDKLYLQVGGGIVLDSEEKAEFEETLQKAASFMKILK